MKLVFKRILVLKHFSSISDLILIKICDILIIVITILEMRKWRLIWQTWIKIPDPLTSNCKFFSLHDIQNFGLQQISVSQRSKHKVLFGSFKEPSLLTGGNREGLIGWVVTPVGPRGQIDFGSTGRVRKG